MDGSREESREEESHVDEEREWIEVETTLEMGSGDVVLQGQEVWSLELAWGSRTKTKEGRRDSERVSSPRSRPDFPNSTRPLYDNEEALLVWRHTGT